jgi:hypothetical protein
VQSKIQNKLHWHINRILNSRTISEKLPKIPLFEPSLILQLWLLGSHQHPQSGVLLTSFPTWGTENGLVEINLESIGGGGKGLYHFLLGQKFSNTRIIVQQQKISRAEILFQNPKNYSLGDSEDSATILDVIRRLFLTKSAATAAVFTLSRVNFGWLPLSSGGMWWRSWLRHCAANQKVAGSIPDGVIGIFH